MGTIYDSFEGQLADWARRFADSPQDEMVALCLLALEREELVAIAYREDLILQRLASMPLADEAREIIHRALVWAWKDEEMHAIYGLGIPPVTSR